MPGPSGSSGTTKAGLGMRTSGQSSQVSGGYSNTPTNFKTKPQETRICPVSTVEDFWALYNHIEVPSKIPVGSDYSLFKEITHYYFLIPNH